MHRCHLASVYAEQQPCSTLFCVILPFCHLAHKKIHGILTWVQLKFQHRLKKRKTVNVKKKKKPLHSFIYSVLKPMMCQAQSLRTERTMVGNQNVAGWVRIMGLREVLQEITSKLKPGKLNEYELSRQKQKRRRKEECHRRALPK